MRENWKKRRGEEKEKTGWVSLAQPAREREREERETELERERERGAFPVTTMGSSCVFGEPATQTPLASMPRDVFLGNLLTLLDCNFEDFIVDRTCLAVTFNHLFKIVF